MHNYGHCFCASLVINSWSIPPPVVPMKFVKHLFKRDDFVFVISAFTGYLSGSMIHHINTWTLQIF